MSGGFDEGAVAARVPDAPDVWTVLGEVSAPSSSGCGFLPTFLSICWRSRRWEHLDDVGCDGRGNSVMWRLLLCARSLQTVQRAELWCVILALHSSDVVHLGVDNLNVARQVGRLLDGNRGSCPVELLNDGDLILLIDRMLAQRGRGRCVFPRSRGRL